MEKMKFKSKNVPIAGRIPKGLKKELENRSINISKLIKVCLIKYAEENNIRYKEATCT